MAFGADKLISPIDFFKGHHIRFAAVSFSGQMSVRFCWTAGASLCVSPSSSRIPARHPDPVLQEQLGEAFLSATGNRPMDAFAVSKLVLVKEHRPQLYEQIHTMLLAKDYLRYRMTGRLCTDPTDGSNTLLYRYGTLEWNRELIATCRLREDIFPELLPSHSICGGVTASDARDLGISQGTPVVTGAADMACSQLGSGALEERWLAITLSTSVQNLAASDQVYVTGAFTDHQGIGGQRYKMASIFSGGAGVDYVYKLLHHKRRLTDRDYPGCGGRWSLTARLLFCICLS